jgi:hypothetical protein
VTRDKRGYEHIYLVHASNRRGKPSRPRILYWFRTPPGVMVGREPFDEAARRAIESQNPDVSFDWKSLSKITAPPPDAEFWRERRRVERAAKQARLASEREDEAEESDQPEAGEPPDDSITPEAQSDLVLEVLAVDPPQELVAAIAADATIPATVPGTSPQQPTGRRRRRRRGGRGRRPLESARSEPGQTVQAPDTSKTGQEGQEGQEEQQGIEGHEEPDDEP